MNCDYLDPSETLRHEPLVYQCKNFIVAHQGKAVPTETLVKKFLGEFTEGKRTRVRQAVETYVNDLIFDKGIISLPEGYLHPLPEQQPYVEKYFSTMANTGGSYFKRLRIQSKRFGLEGQTKMRLGKYDKAVYEVITSQPDDFSEEQQQEPTPVLPKLQTVEYDDYDPSVLSIPEAGQVVMRF